jgi:hypothetical protein
MYNPERMMGFQKRDNEGFAISPAAIIFLVILGSGFLVCAGFAIFRFYGDNDADQRVWQHRSVAQDVYMREVRERAWKRPRGAERHIQGGSNQSWAHAPLSIG